MTTIAKRWQAYADAFEESLVDDDWSRLEEFFTEDASYDGGPEPRVGRDAVLAGLKSGVDNFDRRMDSRTPVFSSPLEDGSEVKVSWKVTYTKAGCPDLVISGTEVAEFAGDRIRRLDDVFDEQAMAAMQKWMTEHGAKLQA